MLQAAEGNELHGRLLARPYESMLLDHSHHYPKRAAGCSYGSGVVAVVGAAVVGAAVGGAAGRARRRVRSAMNCSTLRAQASECNELHDPESKLPDVATTTLICTSPLAPPSQWRGGLPGVLQ